MSERLNPYIAGSPITGPEMFFGREDVFDFVNEALTGKHRDHVLVLYGQRRTGKTSVLYQMSRHIGPRYLCVFIDLHGLALDSLGGFLWELAHHIARSLRREHEIELPSLDRAAFLAEPRRFFETTFLDGVWAATGERHLLLMLDEAVRLEEQVRAGALEPQVFEYLRHLMQHFPRLNFLFSLGSGLEEMQKEYALLFNVALYKKISFLEREAAERLIREPLKDRCPVEPGAVERILEVTSGHPYFTQLICHSLFNRCREPGAMTRGDVDAVLDEVVERGLAVLKHVWEESSPGEKAVLAALASSTALGWEHGASLEQIKFIWSGQELTIPEHQLVWAVRSLVSRDVIRGEQSYDFTVELMRLWVQQYRRLAWVREEIAGEEPLVHGQEAGSIQAGAGTAELASTAPEPVVSTPDLAGREEPSPKPTARPGPGPRRRPVGLWLAYIAVGLAALLGFLYLASNLGILPGSGAGPPGGAYAQVSDMATLGGYIWAATEGGLVRWDSTGNARVFRGRDLGLPEDCVNAVVARSEDASLWLGCGGVVKENLDGGDLTFDGYFNRDSGLNMGTVRALAIGPVRDIWAGGVPDPGKPPPLVAYRKGNAAQPWGTVEPYTQNLIDAFRETPDQLSIESIQWVTPVEVWLGLTGGQVVMVIPETAVVYADEAGLRTSGLPDLRIRRLVIAPGGDMWAAASDEGLMRLRPGQPEWEPVEPFPGSGRSRTVTVFPDGSLWAAGDRWVAHSPDGGETWERIGTGEGLGEDIGALVQDEAGHVWAGAYNGGVSVWDGEQWKALQP